MGRLIDEDAVMYMLTSVELNNGTIKDAKIELRNIKTAYDVEKVVEEIINQPFGNYGVQEENEIIDIVKRGGAK